MAEGRTSGPNATDGGSGGRPPDGPPSGPLSPPPSEPLPPRRRGLLIALMSGLVLVVGVVGVLIGAGGFGGDGRAGGVATAPPTASPPKSAPPTTASSSSSPASATPGRSSGEVLAFGRTQRYEDGVEVTVSAPVAFTPSSGSAGHTAGNQAVTVEITVRNGTDERMDLSLVRVTARDGQGRELARVFDVPPSGGKPVLDVEVKVGVDRPSDFWSGALG
ncbi:MULTISPECIES: hypothetical protein [unclassified Streptomyces]|uniref:hypothetical protein n=1 Tax=unclassified Streptomyces TaxID=2593676 RepID=UPI0006F77277|nr:MULTISPECIES: hypothetical protein [unclassified Streptomyces]KQX50927.1 hypothetical protein ASD33_13000 [Streptomyces sp. Root1304]KRA85093.1 hypothetical protein ASE09_13005 [Streptomyces sp. Root66D1]